MLNTSNTILLLIGGFILNEIRQKIPKIIDFIKGLLVYSYEFQQDNKNIYDILKYIDEKSLYTFAPKNKKHDGKNLVLSGNIIKFKYKGKKFWVTKETKELSSLLNDKSPYFETFKIHTWGNAQKEIELLIEDAIENQKSKDVLTVYINEYSSWYKRDVEDCRDLDSVILDEKEKNLIINDIDKFYNSKSEYKRMGIPYKRGYNLFGIAGSGKTSLVKSLAKKYKKSLFVLNVKNLKDVYIPALFNGMNNSMVLIEDFDSYFDGRKTLDIEGLTFSGLLNGIDGVLSPNNTLFFITTNKKECFDEAMLRPGRLDIHLEFKHASREQAVNIYRRFFPASSEAEQESFSDKYGNKEYSISQLQEIILENKVETLH